MATTTTKILVTGATGTVGAQVVEELKKLGDARIRIGTRSGKGKSGDGVEAVAFSWEDPETIRRAVEGMDAIFLLTPFVDVAVAYAKELVDAAKAAGVKKIVKLSAGGADKEAFPLARWHREAERLVEGSGLDWVILRPNFYMTNFVGYYPPDADGVIALPTGEGKAAWVDPQDIAEVAAHALTSSRWDGKALAIDGPEALSAGDVARILSEVSGRPITHASISSEVARSALAGYGMPGWQVDGMMDLNDVLAKSWLAPTSPTVREVTGHEPRSFADFARAHADALAKK